MLSRGVNLSAVSYILHAGNHVTVQSNKIFDLSFHNSSLAGPLSSGLKYFRFRLRFRQVNQIFRKNLLAVSYCAESDSMQYLTARSPTVS